MLGQKAPQKTLNQSRPETGVVACGASHPILASPISVLPWYFRSTPTSL